ncbi:unnamed protein product [Menidia menidia]|uniref:(Atlantic silverside) hypothetical protein n=1 Tax=Menidia menidia TaxID=238744 RepID=A0A8S4AI18_9TELE|nr:unnamed protein product [Menidia menidia]
MAGNALGIVSCLLLLASLIQGLQDVDVFHVETLEAVVGQNITLTCIIGKYSDVRIVSMEWRKNERTKIAVTSPDYGDHLFWPNVTIEKVINDAKGMMGSHLHIPAVEKWDSGTYSCEISSFPLGSIRYETKVKVKDDIKIVCDTPEIVVLHYGENATIHCREFSNSVYKWTKDNKVVSENASLELWQVSAAHTGVYNLTVKAEDKSLHKEFIISVLTATTSFRTASDPVTVSAQTLPESAQTSLTTSLTTGSATRGNGTTRPNTGDVSVTAEEHLSPSTISPNISVPSSPATHSDTYHSLSSTYVTAVFRSTQKMAGGETTTESETHTLQPKQISVSTEESSPSGSLSQSSKHPIEIPSGTTRITVLDRGSGQSHRLLLSLLIPVLLLIALAGFFYWRHIRKKRMDLPPPFKPPPPPIKYTAVRHSEAFTESFPISRCNSVVEPKEITPTFTMA